MGSQLANLVFDGTAYIDLAKGQLRSPVVHPLGSAPGTPTAGQIYYDTGTNKMYYYNGSTWIDTTGGAVTYATPNLTLGTANAAGSASSVIRSDATILAFDATAPTTQAFGDAAAVGVAAVAARRDHKHAFPAHDDAAHGSIHLNALAAATGNYSMGSNRITSVADPTGAQDAATKAYVDATAAGIDWKGSVRAATTANIANLAGGAPNTLDGVTLAGNDRVLVKDQSTGSQNGIYSVQTLGTGSNGTWVRASDADTSAEVTAGTAVFVEEGTANADSGWVLTTNQAITLGTTSLTFTQFTGLGSITAGNGLTKTGNTIDGNADGTTIEISSDAFRIAAGAAGNGLTGGGGSALAVGAGTGISVAADTVAVDTAVVARKFASSITGGATSEVVTHNLGTRDVVVELVNNATPWDRVGVDWEATSTNTVTLRAAGNLPAGYRCVVHG